jgi:hypothetical protein
MSYVKYAIGAIGIVAAILAIVYGIMSAGGQGIFVLALCLIPAALAAFGTVVVHGMPRWGSIVSALSFALLAMKTREGADFQNIMMMAVLGLLLAVVLAIKPDGSKAGGK